MSFQIYTNLIKEASEKYEQKMKGYLDKGTLTQQNMSELHKKVREYYR